ncbi:adenylate kinase isoenzyme 6-like isoform X2 [Dendronephthya gigantea]|uniref:adenylate kinase isoenzyme 6-like isoform X2 n=1 Tax=Dendronephthya gigantea TaxID=151771 RepID=UPI00106B5AD1|nr:adenylate kinase isoenzyme 6-like isoform X2 [Dendronephthya gigantea]
MAAARGWRKPNILITGTPGTGKTVLGMELSKRTEMNYVNVGDLAKENNFYEGWDEERDCHVIDEDRVLDELEDIMGEDNTVLYNRLEKREYSEKKIQENVECEIFQSILEEARESYSTDIVHECVSNTPEEMERNLDNIQRWLQEWPGL